MIRSMTGYGRAVASDDRHSVTVELKSVNSRFLDCSVKLPRKYLFLEDKVKGYIQSRGISRGKVDVFLSYEFRTAEHTMQADTALAQSYYRALCDIAVACGIEQQITVADIARLPDVLVPAAEEIDTEAEWQLLLVALEPAVDEFISMRESEGDKTGQDIIAKIEKVSEYALAAAEISRRDIDGYRDKLESRIRQILADNRITVDENRILTECAIVADRLAVDEEIARLSAHRRAFYEIIEEPGPCGKKLDFLMQEFNRETNTLGSKANDSDIARLVVNMKNELEKVREQVQNIE